jgi:hypothetical protein
MEWIIMLKLWGNKLEKPSQAQTNLKEYSKEGGSPKRTVFPMMMMKILHSSLL